MHPELLNNTLFLNYYKLWQENPDSIVFAPIAEYFLKYGMIDDAYKICREGLGRHPRLVSGRLVMAKIHIKRGNFEEAEDEIKKVFLIVPGNNTAHVLLEEISHAKSKEDDMGEELKRRAFEPLEPGLIDESVFEEVAEAVPPSWNTVTMAKIFAEQGHHQKARHIVESILVADPTNIAAKAELDKILNDEFRISK